MTFPVLIHAARRSQISWTGSRLTGSVSQSAQFAPYDAAYEFLNTTPSTVIYDTDVTYINDYKGGPYQQAVSGVSYTDPEAYELDSGTFSSYGWEAWPGSTDAGTDGYITWYSSGEPAWTMQASAVGPNAATQVSQRLVSREPMAIILNLGISDSFQTINWQELTFPATMLVDYVRVRARGSTSEATDADSPALTPQVYQLEDEPNLGCNPPKMPTSDYINNHLDAYMVSKPKPGGRFCCPSRSRETDCLSLILQNPNYTTWKQAGYTKPKNSMQGC